jgi:hypothetical protein
MGLMKKNRLTAVFSEFRSGVLIRRLSLRFAGRTLSPVIIDDRVEAVPLEQHLRMQSGVPRPFSTLRPPFERV